MRKTSSNTKGPSQRQLQVGEEIRHTLVNVLARGGFNDPVLMDAGRITISEVKISPDLKNATAYVMTLGGRDLDITLQSLNTAAPQLRHELGSRIRMKFIPKLSFIEDTTFAHAEYIDRLIRSANVPTE